MMPVHAGWMERTLDRASRSADLVVLTGSVSRLKQIKLQYLIFIIEQNIGRKYYDIAVRSVTSGVSYRM